MGSANGRRPHASALIFRMTGVRLIWPRGRERERKVGPEEVEWCNCSDNGKLMMVVMELSMKQIKFLKF